ncbi:NADP-dependent oxidoreductase [Enteractinococcus fodinae]|uniref:NADPH:quinone reductase-like Zn-dependent oxidoreductase n=1 Tax=Enteractinococcus fodinae TaxID=684663 RepID=A0ABU2AZ06_9MICC|nr:NADP-dependent oxidoreductase [Enteractinococcus fodinae]MDR7346577.1 NADPH:quinone reductase-like Zn-dependent oxidoreductase [Enteractinococcus fodinae]
MKAIAFSAPGGPEVLEVMDLPDPELGEGQVLIRVQATAVSPVDLGIRARKRSEHPTVVGMDAAGVIEAIDENADTDLKVGDRVMAFILPCRAHGGYAQRVAVSVNSVARMPEGATFAEAATLPMNGLTARLALDTLNLPKGSTLAVTGAAGVMGGYAVQLAKADGLTVIADASEEDDDLVESLGADIVKLRGEGFADAVREKFPNGVDGIIDAAAQTDEVVPAAKDGAKIITIRGAEGERDRGVTLYPISVADYDQQRPKMEQLRQLVEDGDLTLRVADVLPMDQAPEAHRRMEAGGVRGRIVIELGDLVDARS